MRIAIEQIINFQEPVILRSSSSKIFEDARASGEVVVADILRTGEELIRKTQVYISIYLSTYLLSIYLSIYIFFYLSI